MIGRSSGTHNTAKLEEWKEFVDSTTSANLQDKFHRY